MARKVTINGGSQGKKTPKIASTGELVAERRTIGWRSQSRHGPPLLLVTQVSGRFDPIISTSSLPRPLQPYCRSPSATARHPTPCVSVAHIQDALQAKDPLVASPPDPATPRRPSQDHSSRNSRVLPSTINSSPSPSIVASQARPACAVPSESVQNGSQEDRDQGHQG